jgi:hypothetical protein
VNPEDSVTKDTRSGRAPDLVQGEYEPPQVERVINADALAREVHYAGKDQVSP